MGVALFWVLFSMLVGWHAHDLGKNGWLYCWASIIFSPVLGAIALSILKNYDSCFTKENFCKHIIKNNQ